MALTNAERQAQWRKKRNEQLKRCQEAARDALQNKSDLKRVKEENSRLRREIKRLEAELGKSP